ncbi:MAG: enoyl-CoA hydratase-related protein [Devosiaceae bacterium]
MSVSTSKNQGMVELNCDGAHAAITIVNPARKNAVSLAMWQQIASLVEQADADPSIHLITLRGHSGTFVSGADISEFEETRSTVEKAAHYEAANGAALAALRNAKTPTLALIEGFCFGGGIGLAAASDLRLASSTAKFCVPAAKLGLAYPVEGVRDVARLIGPARVKRLFYTAEVLDAQAALSFGFVEDVAEKESFDAQAQELIQTILSRAPLTQRAAKSAVAAALDPAMEPQAQRDATTCFGSQDYAEGWNAFLEKRTPQFKGN